MPNNLRTPEGKPGNETTVNSVHSFYESPKGVFIGNSCESRIGRSGAFEHRAEGLPLVYAYELFLDRDNFVVSTFCRTAGALPVRVEGILSRISMLSKSSFSRLMVELRKQGPTLRFVLLRHDHRLFLLISESPSS